MERRQDRPAVIAKTGLHRSVSPSLFEADRRAGSSFYLALLLTNSIMILKETTDPFFRMFPRA